MQAIMICSSDDQLNVGKSPGGLIPASKPTNIASVRAASLRTSGLRAAARAASNKASQQMGLPSSVSGTSSTPLSYANSLEPGEESQQNAFAMVDKLIDLNESLIWQTRNSSKVAEQSCMTGFQIIKGVQSLVQGADMKSRQGKLGIYDWIDSQSDDTGKASSISNTEQKQHVHDNKGKERCQALMADMVIGNNLSGSLLEERVSLECQPGLAESAKDVYAKEGTTNLGCPLFISKEDNIVGNALHEPERNYHAEEADLMDIGTNTQIALEAMDIMRHSAPMGNHYNKKEGCSASDIGSNTQTALDAIDILRCGIEPNLAAPNGKKRWEGECLQHYNLGEGLKVNQIEDVSQVNAFSLPVTTIRKRGSSTGSKPIHKKGLSRRPSKTSKKGRRTASVKPAGLESSTNKSLFFDFSSAMIPRRKRSRFCSPWVSINGNDEAFRWRKFSTLLGKPNHAADKLNNGQGTIGMPSPANGTKDAVLTESINGKLHRQKKREVPTELDCCTLLEQSRKRRRCESGSVFVLFSQSLSEATVKQQKKILKRLGGHVAALAVKATHFVADSFVRSKNMLEIMAAGKMVVTSNWLEGCSQAQYFVEEDSYILKDSQKEKEWGFCMQSSLAASRRRPLLKGMKIAVSPNTIPEFTAMKAIIESAGGEVLQKPSILGQSKPDGIASISFIIASEEDYDFCAEYIREGCKVYSTELILNGVVIQSLDLSRNRLFVGQ